MAFQAHRMLLSGIVRSRRGGSGTDASLRRAARLGPKASRPSSAALRRLQHGQLTTVHGVPAAPILRGITSTGRAGILLGRHLPAVSAWSGLNSGSDLGFRLRLHSTLSATLPDEKKPDGSLAMLFPYSGIASGFQHRMLSTAICPTISDQRRKQRSKPGLDSDGVALRYLSTKSDPPSLDEKNQERITSPPKAELDETTLSNHPDPTAALPSMAVSLASARASAVSLSKAMWAFLRSLPPSLLHYLTHPTQAKERLAEIWAHVKVEAHHYWMGSKLLWADIRTARFLLMRTLSGSSLTRRERKQLLRTTTDLFRVVPMSIFLIIPFMEFLLPVALKVWPNMLPSTFQNELKTEENMKRQLQARLAMVGFFQETLQGLAKDKKKKATSRVRAFAQDGDSAAKTEVAVQEETAATFLEFVDKARSGELIPPDVIIRFSGYFKDELTLDNMSRMQLVNMCRYMNIPPYGSDPLLVFQLRYKIRSLKEDDQKIMWEGINSLTKMELREACQERGMRSIGLSKKALRKSLQQWLDLSAVKDVPISLLIMSRTFFLKEEMESRTAVDADGSKSLSGLADAISGLDREVVNEIALDVATPEEIRKSSEVLKIKLEVLEKENDLIDEEFLARKVAREKAEAEAKTKEKVEAEKTKTKMEALVADSKVVAEGLAIGSTTEHSGVETGIDKDGVRGESETFQTSKQILGGSETSPDTTSKSDSAAESESDNEEETELSAEEIDALTQIVSSDPVQHERKELERIKAALAEGDEEELVGGVADGSTLGDGATLDTTTHEDLAVDPLPVLDEITYGTRKSDAIKPSIPDRDTITLVENLETVTASQEDERLEMAMTRLTSRIEGMVGKIEQQLGEAQSKIGDKLHFLDKDMDGILTPDEVAKCLRSVLKRKLSDEEALEIAREMDENEDGFISVDELNRWCQLKRISKLVEGGKCVDNDMANMKEEEESQNERKENKI